MILRLLCPRPSASGRRRLVARSVPVLGWALAFCSSVGAQVDSEPVAGQRLDWLDSRGLEEYVQNGGYEASGEIAAACERRLHRLRYFPQAIPPRGLSRELTTCLSLLESLSPERAVSLAASLVDERADVLHRGVLDWSALELLARGGEQTVVQTALSAYFEAPTQWNDVLSEASRRGDPRLVDFVPALRSDLPAVRARWLAQLLLARLARTHNRATQRRLYRWARDALDDPATHEPLSWFLSRLPRSFPYSNGIDSRLARLARSTSDWRVARSAVQGLSRRKARNRRAAVVASLDGRHALVRASALVAARELGHSRGRLIRWIDSHTERDELPVLEASLSVLMALGESERAHELLLRRPDASAAAVLTVFPASSELEQRDSLTWQRVVARVSSRTRVSVLRESLRFDAAVVAMVPILSREVASLYPYLVRSRRRRVQLKAIEATLAPPHAARALASYLLSANVSDEDKRRAILQEWKLEAAGHAVRWYDVVSEVGPSMFERIARWGDIPLEELRKRWIEGVALDPDARAVGVLSGLKEGEARLRLERAGSVHALEALLYRSDRALSIATLVSLRRDAGPRGSFAAAILLSLGATGSTTIVPEYRGRFHQARIVLRGLKGSPIEPRSRQQIVELVASSEQAAPDGLVALCHFARSAPMHFLSWWTSARGALVERVRFALSLCGLSRNRALLVDLAVSGDVAAERLGALRALGEIGVGSYARRLHRMAGDPNREIRFWAAVALANPEETWTIRLLLSAVDSDRPDELSASRRALLSLPRQARLQILETVIRDGTGGPIAVDVYLRSVGSKKGVEESSVLEAALRRDAWSSIESHVSRGSTLALMLACGLEVPDASEACARWALHEGWSP